MTQFEKIDPKSLNENVFRLIGDEWMLISAGVEGNFNCMTASWGGMGVLWSRPTAACVIRPQRHTFEFAEKNELITLSFFGGDKRSELNLLGSKSGRDIDKMHICGLTPRFDIPGAVYYDEARLVIIGRKLYADTFKNENFTDKSVPAQHYGSGDTHMLYILEIKSMLAAQ
ncbi:MAG: flavin reductase family protein [Eubacteriales bacterium]